MNAKRKAGIALMAIVFGLIVSPAVAIEASAIAPDQINFKTIDTFYKRGVLTSPSDDNPFGGSTVGNYLVRVNGNEIKINIDFFSSPSEGMVFEGWLVDVDTDYKLSLGQFDKQNSLFFEQDFVNPWIYNVLVITEEPFGDTDPAPNSPVGGTVPSEPFGQY